MRLYHLLFLLAFYWVLGNSNDVIKILDYKIEDISDTMPVGFEPINLGGVNSKYDDYNSFSGAAGLTMESPLIFSTNRKTNGGNFDLICYRLGIIQNYSPPNDSATTQFYIKNVNDKQKYLNKFNTRHNEYGPYWKIKSVYKLLKKQNDLFFITRDKHGNQDILYRTSLIYPFHTKNKHKYISFKGRIKKTPFINTDSHEAYASVSFDNKNLYFCSNRNGDFDIYRLTSENGYDIFYTLKKKSPSKVYVEQVLNSGFDDKCPFVSQNTMIFSSNREGGYGGYDLYFSIFENNKWIEPINFGPVINSEFDEFRPIIVGENIMIFSSNRPNGKGGFDLYIVRIGI